MPTNEKILTETTTIYKKPKMYCVIFHNDDYTTMEFVMEILQNVFHKSEEDAFNIMMNVHKNGKGIAGTYTYDIAVTKKLTSENLAQEYDFPLKITIDEAMEWNLTTLQIKFI